MAAANVKVVRIRRQKKGVPDVRENNKEAGPPKSRSIDVAKHTFYERVKG